VNLEPRYPVRPDQNFKFEEDTNLLLLMYANIFNMSKTKNAVLGFVISEIFIIIIEMKYGVPLNAYYYLNLILITITDSMLPFLPTTDQWAEYTGNLIFITNFFSMILWILSSPALLIAAIVYLLTPSESSY